MGFLSRRADPEVFDRIVQYFHDKMRAQMSVQGFSLKELSFDSDKSLESLLDLRDLNVSLADNAQQRAYVTGGSVPVPSGFDMATIALELSVNGAVVERALGREVLGTPAASIAWLANKLAEFGLALEAGMKVMSGSFTRQYPIARGDRIEARFDPIGPVRAEFV